MSAAVSLISREHGNHWTKRPRPIVRLANPTDLDWDPEVRPLYSLVDGVPVRAGEEMAIVRPGLERWPLGRVSDHYRPTSHRASMAAVRAYAADLVQPNGIVIAGHGYHVAHGYTITHTEQGARVELPGIDDQLLAPVACKIVIANDHSGQGAMRGCLVVYCDGSPLGSIVRNRALHVGAQPDRWHADIGSMAETAVVAQDALLHLLEACANRRIETDADLDLLTAHGLVQGVRGPRPTTVLDAMRKWHQPRSGQITWGVWERRLDDVAILAACKILGRRLYGGPLDIALGGHRYGGLA